MWSTASGYLGRSIGSGRPVGAEVMRAVCGTLLLTVSASGSGFPLGVTLGFVAGCRRDAWIDREATALAIGGASRRTDGWAWFW